MADVSPESLLTRVPGWGGQAHVVRSLDGGITNRNYLIAVGDEQFVLRVSGHDTHLLEIDRRREFEAARRAATLGIAPGVKAWIEPEGYLVTEFVDGVAVSAQELGSEARLRSVVESVHRFHESGPLSGDFGAFSVPRLHMSAVLARGGTKPSKFDRVAELATEIEAAFNATPEPRVAAHNDLLNANFLDDGVQLWLIDWEYAGNNDRYFDLANLSVNNSFDDAAEAALLGFYFGEVTERRLARLGLMKIMSDFREAMWAVVQQTVSTIDFDYANYAQQHFDRLLHNASLPHYRAHLLAAATAER